MSQPMMTRHDGDSNAATVETAGSATNIDTSDNPKADGTGGGQPGASASQWLAAPQPHLGAGGLVTLLAVANMMIPLSLDMYTPSVPEMPAHFNTTASMVNMTILGFYLFFAIGLLVFGPISDRIGRRPVLVWGMVLYVAGSALCALSPTIGVLIAARVIEALGAGAVNAVSTALVKDCFVPAKRELMLTIIQTMAVLGPVIAPLVGGLIVRFGSWRLVFWVLTAIGVICLVPSLFFEESLAPQNRSMESAARVFGRLIVVLRVPRFADVLLAASFFSLAFMQYIAVGSYVYVDFFGMTQQQYTYFFAATAAISVLGPVGYLKFGSHLSIRQLTYFLIGIGAIDGVLIATIGRSNVFVFCALMALFAICEAAIRPYTTNFMLMLGAQDAGSASSLINFMNTAFGCLGMALIMLPFPNYVIGIGVLMTFSMLCSAFFWWHAHR